MKHNNKKIVAGIMAGFCVLSSQTLAQYGLLVGNGGKIAKNSSSLQAFGASGEEDVIGNLTYEGCKYELHDDNTATLIDGKHAKNIVEIPQYVKKEGREYRVTKINDRAFHSYTNLTEITIPEGVTEIGTSVFYSCNALKSITLPTSLTKIGNATFSYCTNLTKINIPKNAQFKKRLMEMGLESKINEVDIKKLDDTSMCDGCKYGLNDDNNTATLEDGRNAKNTVEIPKFVEKDGKQYKVTSVKEKAFWMNKYLTGVTLPESVTSIGAHAFYACENLTEITLLANNGEKIGKYAFALCTKLKKVVMLGSYQAMPKNVFDGSATDVEMISMDIDAMQKFFNESALNNLFSSNNVFELDAKNKFAGCEYKLHDDNTATLIKGDRTQETVVIPQYVRKDNKKYRVTNIGNGAFARCESLTEITIPEGVKSIDEKTFLRCKNLKSITLPKTLTNIGQGAFAWCTSLTKITIPEGVTSIGNSAFASCLNLDSITIKGTKTEICNYAFNGCEKLESIEISEGVEKIGDGAFARCTSLTKITIPEGVTSIGNSAFASCLNLDSITIKGTKTEICNYAFNGCKNLKLIRIPTNAQCKDMLIKMELGDKIVEVEAM